MANWKKIIVSGSQAHLSSVTSSNGAIISGSLSVSGSSTFSGIDTLILTGSGFVTGSWNVVGNSTMTGSFTGSFVGNGSGLTNLNFDNVTLPGTQITNLINSDKFFIANSTNGYITYSDLLTDIAGPNLEVYNLDSLRISPDVTGLNSVTSTAFTGSLQGTASNAVSSSYAVTSSFASSSPAVYDFGSFATPTDVGGGGNFGIVTDGDKGDITVTSSGSIWTIDSGSVTYSKIQNVTTSSVLLGRGNSSSGSVQQISLGTGLTMSGTTLSAASSGGGAQIQADIISGSGTWTKPSFAKKISVYLLAGGGGGGSGARQATTLNRCGGAGGAACGYISAFFDATFISSSVSVTIGAGGTTGSSVTADNTNGNNGGAGGVTSFGSYIATGQNGGGNGGATSSTSTGGVAFGAAGFLVAVTTVDGRSGTTSTGTSFLSSGLNFNTMLCGGGGAGAAANVTTTANGGQVTSSNWTTIFPTITFGTPGTNGGNGGNGSNNQIGNYLYLNTGGGGGSYKTGQATGNGGNGAFGAGGGGGAASDNGFASGAGGKGGDGLCIVISEG